MFHAVHFQTGIGGSVIPRSTIGNPNHPNQILPVGVSNTTIKLASRPTEYDNFVVLNNGVEFADTYVVVLLVLLYRSSSKSRINSRYNCRLSFETLAFVVVTFLQPKQKSSTVSCRAFIGQLPLEDLDEMKDQTQD